MLAATWTHACDTISAIMAIITAMGICSSHWCAVSQQKCTAALLWAKCTPHSSVVLCKTGPQQACVTAISPMEICSFTQVCSEPTEMHCSTDLGKMHSPLFSGALQNRPTAGLCHSNYTHGDLFFTLVCSEPTEMHCSTALGKMHSPQSQLLCKTSSQQACVTAITRMET